jgi:hypothetical protein
MFATPLLHDLLYDDDDDDRFCSVCFGLEDGGSKRKRALARAPLLGPARLVTVTDGNLAYWVGAVRSRGTPRT